MNLTTYLEWFHEGVWKRIGWAAETWRSQRDLHAHGDALAAQGGFYRLVQDSVFRDGPVEVIHEWRAAA